MGRHHGTARDGGHLTAPAKVPGDPSTKEKILAAAAAVLAEDGVVGISTRRIAARAGVNQALVLYHFGSIENLMLEVLREQAERASARAEEQYGPEGDFVDQWREDLRTTLEDVEQGWGKAWLQVMAMVVTDESLLQVYAGEFAPSYRTLALASARRSVEDPADAEALVALTSLLKAGLIINALLGRLPGEDRAIELVTELLRERAEAARSR